MIGVTKLLTYLLTYILRLYLDTQTLVRYNTHTRRLMNTFVLAVAFLQSLSLSLSLSLDRASWKFSRAVRSRVKAASLRRYSDDGCCSWPLPAAWLSTDQCADAVEKLAQHCVSSAETESACFEARFDPYVRSDSKIRVRLYVIIRHLLR